MNQAGPSRIGQKLTPSDKWHFDLSRVQHLPPAPSYYTGFRNLRSPSPSICYPYEYPKYNQYALSQPPICPPEHGRIPPAPLSPTYTISPFNGSPPNSIYIPLTRQLPQDRKVMSKLAKRRGVHIHPLTGRMKIVKRRTHQK
ncbi:unnamed protein product [Acanthocheilonema viteae]|uniref:Uncharacterized protein n=1 Tax=Acanthocheilonema viteae TaxID=6277 RepID=A0A498SLH0_ACAVI|nr:unnamed protein product [Acanthocheilonema viteae]